MANLFWQVRPGVQVLTLHKDALKLLFNFSPRKNPSGCLGSSGMRGSVPCPARRLAPQITPRGGAKRMLLPPGLAGLMWVGSVTRWQSGPEGEALGSGMGTGSQAAGLMFSGSIAGTRGLDYRVEILRQVVIIRRGMGFSACFFYVFFSFSPLSPPTFFFPSPSLGSRIDR